LSRDNWVSWKRELLATARDRGLYSVILGTDELPNKKDTNITMISGVQHVGDVPLTQKIEQWHDRNNAAYNQLLLCISSELQTAIDVTDIAAEAWTILVGKFESKDPSKVSIVRTHYDNYHMVDGQPVTTYLTTMKEFRSQLERMGEKIPDSIHAATILRNVPESWRSIAQTIHMISTNVDKIETKLEAHEADLDAIEISDQAATAFIARSNQHSNSYIRRQPAVNDHIFQSTIRNSPNSAFNSTRARVQRPTMSPIAQKSFLSCDNCGKYGHSAPRCYASGGGMEGQAPWNMQWGDGPNVQPSARTQSSGASISRGASSTNPAQYRQSNDQRAMMAHISNVTEGEPAKIILSTNTSTFSSIEPNSHYWFVDSAATNNICGNINIFESIEDISPIIIETASGDAFEANKRGTVRITLRSEPSSDLEDMPITLLNVIYVPRLKVNLLSVERMTNANVDIKFHNNHSTLSFDNAIFAQGPKVGDLYAYEVITLILPRDQAEYSSHQDTSTPIVHIHTPSPSPSPDVPETEDREVPEDTPDIREDIREGEAQEIEGTDGPGTAEEQDNSAEEQDNLAEEQDLGTHLDIEKDEHDDLASTSYGNDDPHIETPDSNISAFANGEYDLGDEHAYVTLTNDEPSNFREAMRSTDANEWKSACQLEFDTLTGYGTWTLVERPPNTNIVGNRWVFRIKRDNLGNINRWKARLVAQGFSQIPGIDFTETYSPTIRFTSVRFILALVSHYDLEVRQIDVKGAYLNGVLEEDVYMHQPEGFVVEEKKDFVCKLNKGIYGLKQSGRVWYQTLRTELKKLGFKADQADETVYFRRHSNGDFEIAGWYVDDGLLAANSKESMDRMIQDISNIFKIQDLGEPSRLLGIKIERN
jgi:Reverse transcriptase (RNA-dependent DNA polymerase)/gag-polypeptide of LTR copia-type/Pol polyprotein, beta-barrel domain